MTILTGGEPLLRRDILEIIRYAAPARNSGSWSGPTASSITRNLAEPPPEGGARGGLAFSLDALSPERHDAFPPRSRSLEQHRRAVRGSCTEVGLPFIVQTTVGKHNVDELRAIADFAHEKIRRKGLEPVLPGPDRTRSVRLGHEPGRVRSRCWPTSTTSRRRTPGRMLVNAKCAPHYIKTTVRERPGLAVPQGVRRRRGGLPGGNPLPGYPSQRRRHPLPLPARLRRQPENDRPYRAVERLGACSARSVSVRSSASVGVVLASSTRPAAGAGRGPTA